MRFLIRSIDRSLRRRAGIFEYSDHEDCLFRLRVARTDRRLRLRDREVEPGEQVLEVHFWNENAPRASAEGRDLSWALAANRRVIDSFKAMADYIRQDPELSAASAVGGVTTWFAPGENNGAEKLFQRLGFAVTPHDSPNSRFHQFWEQVYAWLLMWAFNAGDSWRSSPLKIPHTDFWMSTGDFLRRFDPDRQSFRSSD
jgi:hypothetical protein